MYHEDQTLISVVTYKMIQSMRMGGFTSNLNPVNVPEGPWCEHFDICKFSKAQYTMKRKDTNFAFFKAIKGTSCSIPFAPVTFPLSSFATHSIGTDDSVAFMSKYYIIQE